MIVIGFLVRGVVLFAAAALLAVLFGRRSAPTRHWIWAITAAGAAILPLTSASPLSFDLPLLPASSVPTSGALDRDRPTADTVEPNATGESEAHNVWVAWERGFALVWLLGVGLLGMRSAVGTVRAFGVLRRSRPVAAERWLGAPLASVPLDTRDFAIRLTEELHVPATLGFGGTILMPVVSAEWSSEQRRMALLHETAHVKRRDYLSHLIGRVARILHWPNPLAWVAERRLLLAREGACDDRVLRAGEDPFAYGHHLVELAQRPRSAGLTPALLPLVRKSEIRVRLSAILEVGLPRSNMSKGVGVGLFGVFAVMLVFLSSGRLVPRLLPVDLVAQEAPFEPDLGERLGSWRLPVSPDAILDLERAHIATRLLPESSSRSRIELHVRGVTPEDSEAFLDELGFRFTISGSKPTSVSRSVRVVSDPVPSRWPNATVTAVIRFPADGAASLPSLENGRLIERTIAKEVRDVE